MQDPKTCCAMPSKKKAEITACAAEKKKENAVKFLLISTQEFQNMI